MVITPALIQIFFAFPILLEHFLELQFSNDGRVIADDSLSTVGLKLGCLRGVLDDIEGVDVAAGDLFAIVVLVVAMLLVDSHRSRVHSEGAVQGGLPCYLVVISKTRGIVNHGIQITGLTWPSIHLAVCLAPRVPGGLRRLAVTMVVGILLDGEAMRYTVGRHVYHPALDTEWGPRTLLKHVENSIRIRCWVGWVPLHMAGGKGEARQGGC